MNSPSRSSAFTLIELLVVISIIGILASLAIPAVNGALDSARRTQANNDVVQIATAVAAYETEYGKLPEIPARGSVDNALIDILMPPSTGPNDKNPRRIVFLEVPDKKAGSKRSGLLGGNFEDPWGNVYQIAIDDDYNHEITGAGPDSETLRKRVAVWNAPSERANRRTVKSWE